MNWIRIVYDATTCVRCLPGRYQPDEGQTSCLLCIPGLYANELSSTKCKACPQGYLQEKPGQKICNEVDAGSIVLEGGTSSVIVPLGSFITKDGSGFQSCLAGTIGNSGKKVCDECDPGKTSFNGSITCIPCAKGKFSKGGTICKYNSFFSCF